MAYENIISNKNSQRETRARFTGLMKKFKNYNYITTYWKKLFKPPKFLKVNIGYSLKLKCPFELQWLTSLTTLTMTMTK